MLDGVSLMVISRTEIGHIAKSISKVRPVVNESTASEVVKQQVTAAEPIAM